MSMWKMTPNKIYKVFLSKYFFRYLLFGGLATIVDWFVYYVSVYSFNFHYALSVTFSFMLGSITNFSLNKYFNFRNKYKKLHNQFFVYLIIAFIGLLFTIFLLWVFIDLLLVDKFLARVIATAVILVYNFLGHKYVTFNIMK